MCGWTASSTLDDFKPGTLAGPLELDDGSYKIAITAADATSADNPVIGPVKVHLKEGRNYTAVAHLDADGDPTATLFKNSTRPSPQGEGKLTVRHVAAAPAVDVLAGDTAVIEDLENPEQEVLTLEAGTVSASVAAAGTTEALIGPADVPVRRARTRLSMPGAAWTTTPWALPSRWSTRPSGAATTTKPAARS